MGLSDTSSRIYPACPRIGVGVLVVWNHKVLLVRRGQEPAKGEWSVPGGLVELGESVAEAAHREISEECNIRIKLIKQLDLFEFIDKDPDQTVKYHFVVLDYLAEYVSGELWAASDIDEARWFTKDQIPALNCSTSIQALVHQAFAVSTSK